MKGAIRYGVVPLRQREEVRPLESGARGRGDIPGIVLEHGFREMEKGTFEVATSSSAEVPQWVKLKTDWSKGARAA